MWILVGLVGLVFFVGVLVYLPPVQKFAVGKASDIIARETGMRLSVDRFRLRFPAGLTLEGATVIMPTGDTLASAGSANVSVRVVPLVSGRLVTRGLDLEDVSSTWRDTVSGLIFKARLANLSVRRAVLNFKRSVVRIPDIALSGADVAVSLGPGTDTISDSPGIDTIPWNIEVGRFELSDSRFAMDIPSAVFTSSAPFDPAHIRATEMGLLVRNFRYDASDMSVNLADLHFVEQSGLLVTSVKGDFRMTPEEIALDNFTLNTTHSHIETNLRAGYGVARMDSSTPVSLMLSADISTDDAFAFLPVDTIARRAMYGRTLTLDAALEGTLGDIAIEKLTAHLPESIDVDIRGRVHNIASPENISGDATFSGTLGNLDFAKDFIPDAGLRSRIAIPRDIKFKGEGAFSHDAYELSAFNITIGAGSLEGRGRFSLRDRNYAALVRAVDFPVGDFLSGDSFGVATLSLSARGHGFDPAGDMRARAYVSVDKLDYAGCDWGEITANLTADGGDISGKIRSRSEVLVTDINLRASIERDMLPALPRGAVAPLRYSLSAVVDSTAMYVGDKTYDIASTTLTASTSGAGSAATVSSGDLSLDMSSPLGLDSLIMAAGSVSNEMRRQLAARHFSADSLQSAFPPLTLTAKAGRDNFLRRISAMHGADFYSVTADVSTATGTPFSIDATVRGLSAAGMLLDTLGLHAHRNGDNLDYSLRMTGRRSAENDNLGLIRVSGSAGGNTLSADVFQRNRSDSVGFDFGLKAALQDTVVRVRMTPANPILGYERWTVESGADWIEYDMDGTFRADLALSGSHTNEYVKMTSASLADTPDGALRLRMAGLPIAPMLDLFPMAPPLDGTAFSDVTFGFLDGWTRPQRDPNSPPRRGLFGRQAGDTTVRAARRGLFGQWAGDTTARAARRGLWAAGQGRARPTDSTGKIIVAKGTIGVVDFSYNGRRVADIDAGVDFQSDIEARMRLSADLSLDKKTALTARGFYSARMMNLTVSVPAVPLALVEGFLPTGAAELSGSLDGELRITGVPTSPTLTGGFGVTGGRINVDMTGTAFGISSDRITIADNKVSFGNFGITSPNRQKLTITGSIDISDLATPNADVRVTANNFQVVNSQHIGGSQIYGNAAFNTDVTARGTLSAMKVRGNARISPTTDIVYILRDQSRVRDEKQHIVEFRVFTDSIFDYADDSLARFGRPMVDMLIGVDIPEGVQATLSLDELNENRVELVGGGALSYSMNTLGDVRLTGRYTLSDGSVYYRPPVIPQKIFAVEDGSYVEWTGEATKPQFHVSATQTSDIEIEYDGSSEQVEFDVSIDISGSLAAMDMRFDVAAPGNLFIQSELLSMTREQRMQQALTLLVYGQYTGPGASSKRRGAFDAIATLNSFISKEVNQWARNNLRGVDLSMGIDKRYDDSTGGAHTDYSYSVSKSLFNDRVKVSIGGSVADNSNSQNFADNLLDDVMVEYRLDERDNMLLKLYRNGTRESILEGEVTETGAGFIMRKKINRFKDLFRRNKKRDDR